MWADFLRLQGSHRARTVKFLSAKAVGNRFLEENEV